MRKHGESSRSLTIYLVDRLFTEPATTISKPAKEHEIYVGDEYIGRLYIEPKSPKPPPWASFFSGYVPPEAFGWVSSSSAVFIVKTSDRLFAITFGQGRYLLAQGCVEERFGLKVVLNSIPAENIRSIDKKSFDAISSNSRVQASQEAGAQDFGIDAEQDLLRAVTGTPPTSLGKRLTGRDALHVVTTCGVVDLKEKLDLYYRKYEEETYKAAFPWVDNISEVPLSSRLRVDLDDKLISLLGEIRQTRDMSKCWLAIPEVIDWERVVGFQYGARYGASIHHDLHLPGYFRSFSPGTPITLDRILSDKACAVDADSQIVNKWMVYRCIHCELEVDGTIYVLSAGRWYAITRDLADLVDQFFDKLPVYERSLPDYQDDDEASYCRRIASQSGEELHLMDQQFIRIAGRTNDIEFCDLFGKPRDLIHIKRYGASSVLNHLFAQGLMSGESLRSLEGFVEELNRKLPTTHKIEDHDIPRDVTGFMVVFAVISESMGALKLPFFARVSLRHAAKRLQSMNFDVSLAKIHVASELSRKERIPPKKRDTKF